MAPEPCQLSIFGDLQFPGLMKKMLTLFLIVLAGAPGFAQQGHFVYINHQEKLPFYVRMGEQIFSSSLIGHLTIAPLNDSVYAMYVGFPRSRYPEQLFEVRVVSADKGLILSNQGGSWQLTDQLTGEVLKPVNTSGLSGDVQLKRKEDSYSMLMADVVDDSSVLYAIDSSMISDKSASPTVAADSPTITARAAKEGAAKEGGALRPPKLQSEGRDSVTDTTAANTRRDSGGVDSARKIDLATVNKEPDKTTGKIKTEKDSIQIVVTTVGGSDSAKSGERSADNVVRNAATDTTAANNDRDAGGVDSAGKKEMGAVKEEPGKTAEKITTEKDSIQNEVKAAGGDSSRRQEMATDKLKAEGRDSGQDHAVATGKLDRAGDSLVGKGEVTTDSLVRSPGDSVELDRLAAQQKYQTRVRPEAKAAVETSLDTPTAAPKADGDIVNKDQKTPLTEVSKPATDSGSRKGRKSRRQRKETGPDPAVDGDARVGDSNRVIRLEEVESREGRVLLYLDRSGGLTDTIRLIIPRL